MLLYDKHDHSLKIYDFSANDDDVEKYRRREMQKIPAKERVMIAETFINLWSDTPIFEYYTNNYYGKILTDDYADNKRRSSRRYHFLRESDASSEHITKLLDFYYKGNLCDKNMVRIRYLQGIKYFLLKNKSYKFMGERHGRKYQMDDIIQLPESLYLLQLLQQQNFMALEDCNLSEVIQLFSLEEVDELDLDQLKKTDKLNITNNAYDVVSKKADNDHNILQYLKK